MLRLEYYYNGDAINCCALNPKEAVLCFGHYVGPGYSLPTPAMAKAVRMLARLEGIWMDPVYTGGSPALGVYMEEVLDESHEN